MANWRKKIDIKAILNKHNDEHQSDETAVACAQEIAKLLEPHAELCDFVERFKDACDQGDVNDVLSDLYDYADENLIWLGL